MIFEKYIGIGWCLAGVRAGLLILIVNFMFWQMAY